MKQSVSVLGAGTWGATLGGLLAEKGFSVRMWESDPARADQLHRTRTLSTLPALRLPTSIQVSSSMMDAAKDATVVLIATPSHTVRSVVKQWKSLGIKTDGVLFVNVSKGLEESTFRRMSEVIAEETGCSPKQIVILSGPTHAEEVCERIPTAIVATGTDETARNLIQELFTTDFFRVYTHHDVIGAELGATLKNILAIGCGIGDGLGLGDNSRAAMLTRGLYEMSQFGVKQGAEMLTFFGLTGMGDMIVTCLSKHSRNRLFGEKIGQGKSVEAALSEMTMVVEGYRSCAAVYKLGQKQGLQLPLIEEIFRILYESKAPRQSMSDLMRRAVQPEWRGLTA